MYCKTASNIQPILIQVLPMTDLICSILLKFSLKKKKIKILSASIPLANKIKHAKESGILDYRVIKSIHYPKAD